jgi:hypothetical protein
LWVPALISRWTTSGAGCSTMPFCQAVQLAGEQKKGDEKGDGTN